MMCPRCGSAVLVEISLKLAEKSVSMRSCSKCDTRSWGTDGESVDLRDVLSLAAARR